MGLRYFIIYIIATLSRFFPLPTKTGIFEIGHPNEESPVLVTGNYLLTVEILKQQLKGLDVYLLIANSNGINVWCAATGGHFNNHDIISILKTTQIEDLVTHREYILPQLAATGIEPKVIRKKTGWMGLWGPVYAKDLPQFLRNNYQAKSKERTAQFPISERVEMAISWAFPMSVIFGGLLLFFSMSGSLVFISLIWYIPLVMFLSFPIFESWFQNEKFDGSLKTKLVYPLIIGISTAPVYLALLSITNLSLGIIITITILTLLGIIVLSFDLKGSTPIFKSDLHEDRIFDIRLDQEKCRGAGDCAIVCPKNCFNFLGKGEVVQIPRPDACVQCGACVVQCPFDALYFQNAKGDILSPQTLRTYKLNLMGSRSGKACECTVCKITT